MTLSMRIENVDTLADGGPVTYEIDGRGIDIGRDAFMDWTLPDPERFISGKHCEIHFRNGSYWLHDVSTNGTTINGRPGRLTEPYQLQDGDKLHVGSYIIAVSLGGGAGAPAGAAEQAPENQGGGGNLWGVQGAAEAVPRRDFQRSSSPSASGRAAGADLAEEHIQWGVGSVTPSAPATPSELDWSSPSAGQNSGTAPDWAANPAAPAVPSGGAPDWAANPAASPPPAGDAPSWAANPSEPAQEKPAWAPAPGAAPAGAPDWAAKAPTSEPPAGGAPDWAAKAPADTGNAPDWAASPAPARAEAPGWAGAAPAEPKPEPQQPAAPAWGAPTSDTGQAAQSEPDPFGGNQDAPPPPSPPQAPAEPAGDWRAPPPEAAETVEAAPGPNPAAVVNTPPSGPAPSSTEPQQEPLLLTNPISVPAQQERAAAPPEQPAQPSPTPAGSAGGFTAAFEQAAGLPPGAVSGRSDEQLAAELGVLMRMVAQNLQGMLLARAETKSAMRSQERTMIGALENNPLKFSPSPEDALRIMFGEKTRSYLDATETVEKSFGDLQRHQLQTFGAMQQALSELIEDLDPENIAGATSKDGGLASIVSSRRAKLWDTYVERFTAVSSMHERGMIDAFMILFAEKYDRQG